MRIVFFLIFFSTLAWSEDKKIFPPYSLVRNCHIYLMNGSHYRTFPGDFCQFFDDGSYASATLSSLRYFSKDHSVRWEIPGHYHHQLNLSPDKKRILAMSSDTIERNGEKMRSDKLMIISLEGKVLFQTTSNVILEQAKLSWLDWTMPDWLQKNVSLKKEMSHFNTFYEIGEVKSKAALSEVFKSGNILLSSIDLGVFVLTPDLSKVLYRKSFGTSVKNRIHDVQLTSKGNFLFFNNDVFHKEHWKNYSAVQEIDPSTDKVMFEFTAEPKGMFYSNVCGGVQELNDDVILFSDHLNATYVYSKSKNDLISVIKGTHMLDGKNNTAQQVKAIDLTLFLSHHKL